MHTLLPFLLAMIGAIVVLNMFAVKLKIAYPILMVTGGLLVSFIPGLPHFKINPDLIFFIFLPPLLFASSWGISFKEMKKWWRIIGSFAFLVVFFTALSVAVVTNFAIPGFTLALGFLLGGIVSPPDAVSTNAITSFVKIPRATSAILEGESLLNDASSLIIFRFALLAVGSGQFIWQHAALSFLWMVLGGTAIGLIVGWLFVQAHKRLPTDASSDIALTLIEPYFMYWIAEQAQCSGVLAVVSGGLYMSTRQLTFLNSTSRVQGFSFWESFVFILNGVVFLIIGLGLPEIVDGLHKQGISLKTAIGYGVLVTGVLILARIISSYAAMISTVIFRPSVSPTRGANRTRQRFLMPLLLGWTGMRGVVSLAAALAIPVTLSGKPFPQRDLILFVTFVAILLTLVIQGLTLPYFIRRSGLFGTSTEKQAELVRQKMKEGLREHIHAFLKSKYENELKDDPGMELFLRHWEEKTQAVEDGRINEKSKAVMFEMLGVQRSYLAELNRDPKIDEEIIREQLYQIDLEEERLKMI